MKKYILSLLLVLAVVFSACALSACSKDAGGVEKLSIETANVFLAPNDTYQLKIDVHPLNAQINTALTYYVPSQYTQYVKVSADGLITAIENTPEGVVVPLRVTSTTNKNATLTVNVVVETVSVKRIYFDLPETVTMQMGSSGYDLKPLFEPSHASDGRSISYESLNPDIVSVDTSGHVTPLKGGMGSVKASSKTSVGTSISTQVTFLVKYSEGSYRLETSDRNPQYSQVLGKAKPINFRLMILNPNSDPDVTIYWYVGTERIPSADNMTQYNHTPEVETCTSYRVYAKVKTKNEEEKVFASEEITIHNPFLGFTLDCKNITSSRRSYRYGETAAFELLESTDEIKTYDWYLKRLNESGLGVLVATTVATSRNLSARMNLDGEFVLTAVGKDEKGTALSTDEFEFGVTKLDVGDAMVFTPVLEKDGLPPESYNFYLYECNENGEELTEGKHIGSCLKGEAFYYVPTVPGYYKIKSQAVLDGIIATIDVDVLDSDGKVIDVKSEPFTYESGLFIIGNKALEAPKVGDLLPEESSFDELRARIATDIYDVSIKGITYLSSNRIFISWASVRKSPSYVIELTAPDGKIYLFDSDEKGDAVFGNSYVILPAYAAPIDGSFAVRIKHKGYLFSPSYYYGFNAPQNGKEYYFDTVPEAAYDYLKTINGTINGYLASMKDLGELLNYIILNRPSNNGSVPHSIQTVNGALYDAYTFNAYFAFDLAEAAKRYPHDADLSDREDNGTLAVCEAVLGAQSNFCPANSYSYTFKVKDIGYEITVMMKEAGETKTTEASDIALGTSANFSKTPYGADNRNFPINTRKTVPVTDAKQLYHALANGNCPQPSGSDLVLNLYNRILSVVNTVVGAEMNDYQKVLAFYDYLTTQVVYDDDLVELTNNNDPYIYDYAGFTIEGVFFYKKAVCSGIAEAFVSLCAIEGIPAVKVSGKVNGVNHAFNKVLIDDVWYIVDATNGRFTKDGELFTNHNLFLVNSERYKSLFNSTSEYGATPDCVTELNYFENTSVNGVKLKINNLDELTALLTSLDGEASVSIELQLDPDFANGDQASEVIKSVALNKSEITLIIPLARNRVIIKTELTESN